MYIILGGTGHIGSATVRALLAEGQDVTIVTSDRQKAGDWLKQSVQSK